MISLDGGEKSNISMGTFLESAMRLRGNIKTETKNKRRV
jgi:hypothetical protein